MTLERSSYQMSSDRVNELLSKERQLFAIADAPRCVHGNVFSHFHPGPASETALRIGWCEGAPKLAARLDAVVKEAEPTEPMCVYCGWSGEGLAEHEQNCKPMWAALDH